MAARFRGNGQGRSRGRGRGSGTARAAGRSGKLGSQAMGKKGFDEFFAAVYGERWPSLLKSMQGPTHAVALLNRHILMEHSDDEGCTQLHAQVARAMGLHPQFEEETAGKAHAEADQMDAPTEKQHRGLLCRWPHTSLPALYVMETANNTFPPPTAHATLEGQLSYYCMDAASLLPVHYLDVDKAFSVLDMCSAPGGKSVAMMQLIQPAGYCRRIVLNEISASRRQRLCRVVDHYAPQWLKERIEIMGRDGTRPLAFGEAMFDRVLLDAPCSSERHLLHDPSEMQHWSPQTTIDNAARQFSLLRTALQATKPGGRVVYSTCSISDAENDQVVERVLQAQNPAVKVVSVASPIGIPTRHGWHILPDDTTWGPIYFSVLERPGASA